MRYSALVKPIQSPQANRSFLRISTYDKESPIGETNTTKPPQGYFSMILYTRHAPSKAAIRPSEAEEM